MKPYTIHIGRASKSQPQIISPLPVHKIMPAGIPFFRIIGNFIPFIPRLCQYLLRFPVHQTFLLFIRQWITSAIIFLIKRSPLFQDQAVSRNMLRCKADDLTKSCGITLHNLVRKCCHQIHVDILKTGFSAPCIGVYEVLIGVNTSECFQFHVICRLQPYAESVDPHLIKCPALLF